MEVKRENNNCGWTCFRSEDAILRDLFKVLVSLHLEMKEVLLIQRLLFFTDPALKSFALVTVESFCSTSLAEGVSRM